MIALCCPVLCVKTHKIERESIFRCGEAGLPHTLPLMRSYADVGSTKASERTPTCTKQGFNLTGARLARVDRAKKESGNADSFRFLRDALMEWL